MAGLRHPLARENPAARPEDRAMLVMDLGTELFALACPEELLFLEEPRRFVRAECSGEQSPEQRALDRSARKPTPVRDWFAAMTGIAF